MATMHDWPLSSSSTYQDVGSICNMQSVNMQYAIGSICNWNWRHISWYTFIRWYTNKSNQKEGVAIVQHFHSVHHMLNTMADKQGVKWRSFTIPCTLLLKTSWTGINQQWNHKFLSAITVEYGTGMVVHCVVNTVNTLQNWSLEKLFGLMYHASQLHDKHLWNTVRARATLML